MGAHNIGEVVSTISIHAPREGRDCESGEPLSHKKYFNPRAPRGARLPSFIVTTP